uniref:Uncharacterized protein n=1 Tax=Cacopsylla melanoneura TaxID=428564 RepID=A0A8D9DYR1_9HEMI
MSPKQNSHQFNVHVHSGGLHVDCDEILAYDSSEFISVQLSVRHFVLLALLSSDQLLLDVCRRSLPVHVGCGNILKCQHQTPCLLHHRMGSSSGHYYSLGDCQNICPFN